MPTPILINGVYHYRVQVPRNIADIAKGGYVPVTVDGKAGRVKVGTHVKVSLRTREPVLAKQRFVEVAGQVEAHYELLRSGPEELKPKQALAIAGAIRAVWVDAFDEDPKIPALWERVREAYQRTAYGPFAELMVETGEVSLPALEERFGPMIDTYLSKQKLKYRDKDRPMLLKAVAKAMGEAVAINLRKSQEDYSPDTEAIRYPPLKPRESEPARAAQGLTFAEAIDERVSERKRGIGGTELRPATVRKHQIATGEFADHRGSELVAGVTVAEVHAWRDAMIEAGKFSNKTITDRMMSIRTVVRGVDGYSQALGNLKTPRQEKVPGDQKTYTVEEAKLILTQARDEEKAELRWLPWLCAYSGARVNEAAQLTGEDIFEVEGEWFMRITTMGKGKTLKNEASERRVPIHPHVIDEGFVKWAESQRPKDERLFPKRAAQNVSDWVRKRVGFQRESVRPNHGWRHLFEDRCTVGGMTGRAVNAITGRSGGGSAALYGRSRARLPGLAMEMKKFPRYFGD